MLNKFKCPMVAIAAATIFGCGASDNSFSITVEGKVLASHTSDETVQGASVSCAGSSLAGTITAADGTFTLKCTLEQNDAAEDAPLPTVTVWFEKAGLAPVFKTLMPVAEGHFTIVPVMHKATVEAEVAIPTGNTTIPFIMDSASLSFARETLLDATGVPVTGTVTFPAADWDNSLPPEVDEESGDLVLDSLSPLYTRYFGDNDDSGVWMRPIAATWFGLSPNTVNPEVPVDLQLSTRFADDVLGRELAAGDADLYLMDRTTGRLQKNDDAVLNARNQISAPLLTEGMWLWLVRDDSHACISVTVKKGDLPAAGAHVSAYRIFADLEQIFYDEQIGADSNGYCLRVLPGQEIRIKASVAGENGVSTKSIDVLSGGTASCGTGCTETSITFPCDNKDNCETARECIEGTCQVVEPI